MAPVVRPSVGWKRLLVYAVGTLALAVVLIVNVPIVASFVSAVAYRMSDFELSISVDKSDCFLIIWTRRNKDSYHIIEGNTLEALEKTNFDRSGWILISALKDSSSSK